MAMRGARIPLGSTAWVAEERNSAVKIAEQEVEEFSFSARNDFDWLNEHMAGIFDENEINVAGVFKTPGRLRTKTPHTTRKQDTNTVAASSTAAGADSRLPLSDIFSSTTPTGAPNRFTQQLSHRTHSPSVPIPDDIGPDNDNEHPERAASPSPIRPGLSPAPILSASKHKNSQQTNAGDSGFYGSQSQNVDIINSPTTRLQSANRSRATSPTALRSPSRQPTSPRFAYMMLEKDGDEKGEEEEEEEEEEERPKPASRVTSPIPNWATNLFIPPTSPKAREAPAPSSPIHSSPMHSSPTKSSPSKSSPLKNYTTHAGSISKKLYNTRHGHISDEEYDVDMDDVQEEDDEEDEEDDDARSHSLSPVRPVMRKSSLNFAPFPAREPLAHKSTGARVSRTSNLEMLRNSYYPRTTSGKSLGGGLNEDAEQMDFDEQKGGEEAAAAVANTMTYTQKLQDKISKLSEQQPKAARSSKSIHGLAALSQAQNQVASKSDAPPMSPPRKLPPLPINTTPGAFPGAQDDDDEEWVDAPASNAPEMESVEDGFVVPKQRQITLPDSPSRTGNTTPIHVKHMPLSLFPDTNPTMAQLKAHHKSLSISSYNSLVSLPEAAVAPTSPMKSPSRSMRESPLKQVKNKLSSILKGSKSLLASSAVASAEGKQMLSPTANRIMSTAIESTDSLHAISGSSNIDSLYPDLSARANEAAEIANTSRPVRETRASTEREKQIQRDARLMKEQLDKLQRARDLEREKVRQFNEEQEREKQRAAKELKIQQERERQEELERQQEQERIEREEREEQERLERERELERQQELMRQRELEKERKLQLEREQREKRERELELQRRQREREQEEHERALERERQLQQEYEEAERLEAQRLEEERQEREYQRQLELEREHEAEAAREAEAEREAEFERERELEAEQEREMEQKQREKQKVLNAKRIPTPTESERPKSRTALASPRKVMRTRQPQNQTDEDNVEIVAQTPARSTASMARPPTAHSVRKEIKRPAKPVASTKSRVEPPKHIVVKPTSLYHPSTASLSANLSETLDASASSRSQLSMKSSQGSLKDKDASSLSLKSSVASSNGSSRSRSVDLTAKKREQEEQRRKEAKAELERKRAAQQDQRRTEEKQKEEERKAAEAKKKQRQAAIERAKQTRAPPPASRPQPIGPLDYASQGQSSRPPSRVAQTPADIPRPMSAMKGTLAAKRQLEEEKSMQNRNGPSYQAQDSKRRRTGDDFDDDEYEVQQQPLKGPPVRPSSALKRDVPTKSTYGQPTAGAAARDLFKNQPNKGVDMSQFSKGAIPFAGAPAGGAAPNGPTSVFKTPGRTALPPNAKSAHKSGSRPSPRFQNGDNIELPEIETEDEDDEDDEEENARNMGIAPWADSPDLKRALIRQETMDPSLIFGPPAPLNMEEVFSKNKDRWNKFRARTSSANWAGADKLTDEDIRKDMAARDKIRRDGGWSYDLGRDMA